LLAGLTLGPVALSSGRLAAAGDAAETAQFLFVQSAARTRYANGRLTLAGVSPVTVLFSDRPERIAGHMTTADFIPFWSEGENSFASNPPNADLSVLEGEAMDNVVLTLREPKLDGDELSYRVEVLAGELPASGGPASLFIDVIGRPVTPASFAGARRRAWRRAVID
jgi:hypothetical protein